MAYLAHHLLNESALRRPEQLAVAFKEQGRTYAELDAETNRLARVLHAHGVCPGDRVGIYLHKSLESVISIFAILKAGGVYVPLDPNSPPRRVAFIINNCGIRCLVTSLQKLAGLKGVVGDDSPLEIVVLVDEQTNGEPIWSGAQLIPWAAVRAADGSEHGGADTIDTDLAYILYTSGSTGDPKGVMLTHRHALTFIDWACAAFAITHQDRLSNHAPLHFDLSILDIFCAIKAGATVVLVPEGLSTFPLRLVEFIQQQQISIWYSVPSALTLLVLHGKLARFPFERLRTVLFAGEVFPVKYLRALMTAIPHASFYNLYGPTETNVCTYYRVPPLAPERIQPIPIGKACANAGVFALNEQGAVIAPGEEGELYVRGSLLTKGYWGDSQRTERGLVLNPLQPCYPEYVYRTGDIVTLDDEGNYVLIGRRDHMVKSRGYRIELGEVEAALYNHPRVREAVVIPVPDEILGARLRALVVLDEPQSMTPEEIKRHCADRVPPYMVPEVVEFRSALPQTSTGKVDRALLTREAMATL
jgi:amino acid adenylation domain-containing protein